ncbi:MAG: hypothetical protein MI757_15590 [Pirellulales bacterium]|nr:hypothetical protein [Pirellulales bacterium]
MSRRNSKSGRRGRGGYVQKPKSNVYTMMLIMSFVFLCGACLLLHFQMDVYDYEMKPSATTAAAAP